MKVASMRGVGPLLGLTGPPYQALCFSLTIKPWVIRPPELVRLSPCLLPSALGRLTILRTQPLCHLLPPERVFIDTNSLVNHLR